MVGKRCRLGCDQISETVSADTTRSLSRIVGVASDDVGRRCLTTANSEFDKVDSGSRSRSEILDKEMTLEIEFLVGSGTV